MLKFIKYLIYIPVAAALVAFSVANHEIVEISLDPLSPLDAAAYGFHAPMYVVIFASVAVGVIAGGLTVWFGQGRHRRAERQLRSETKQLKAEIKAQGDEPKFPARLARRA